MKSPNTQTFTAYVGIDWADTKHDICLQESGSERREFGCIEHQVECIDEWAKSLHRRFGGPAAIALELAKGPIVYALQKYDFLVLFPINPLTLAKYREAFKPSRAKDDPSDAELALDLLVRHPERFAPLKPQSIAMRTLISLTERRRELVNDKTRLTNRLTHTLKQYYPQVLEWFDQHDTVLFCDFLTRWPTLPQAKRAHQASLKAFLHAHNAHRPKLIAARLAAIKAAVPLTQDPGVITSPADCTPWCWSSNCELPYEPSSGLIGTLPSSPLRCRTTACLQDYPELGLTWRLGCSSPSAKIASASSGPRRFKNTPGSPPLRNAAARRAGYIGAGSVRRSCVRPSSNGPAKRSINRSGPAPYYYQQRAKGSTYQAAVRALAFKWIRILYRCWMARTPYDETKYLNALKKRQSSLLNNLAPNPQSA